ncbi:MAG: hypothetical protein AB8G99_18140 [Planctomycetaceae bacterium]
MNFGELLNKAKDKSLSAFSHAAKVTQVATDAVSSGFGYAKEKIGGTWLFGSTEESNSFVEQFDEKHYFLVPYHLSECQYTLYSLRCLPKRVPPINDLPKRRLFHLPNENAKATVEHLLAMQARQQVETTQIKADAFGTKLVDLANEIDRIDSKMFNGVLLIGGLVVLANPVTAAVLTAQAMIPSVGLLLSRYGLKYVGESSNNRAVQKEIAKAESNVLKEFRAASTKSLQNPMLAQLDRALSTDVFEYDPMLDTKFDELTETEANRYRDLTRKVIVNTYGDLIDDKRSWAKADLGPEDIRWLKMLVEQTSANE